MKNTNRRSLWLAVLLAGLLLALCSCEMTFTTTVPTAPETTAPHDPEPTAPSDTAAPTEPAETTAPTDPAVPTDPAETTAPTDPAVPTDPAETTAPTDPAVPTDPADPSDPTDPVDPSVPTDPADPPAVTDPVEDSTTAPEPPLACAHTPTPIPAVPPTCTAGGSTEGSVCGDCGEVLTSPTNLPPTGHTFEATEGYACGGCGLQATCPAPTLRPEGDLQVNWGETLTLSWSLPQEAAFPVVYMVTEGAADRPSVHLWENWQTDTAYTRPCRTDGETFTLQVLACYAVEGQPVPATESASATLTVTVSTREAMESPAFLSGNEVTVDPETDLTVAWSAVTAEGASVLYYATLTTPDGSTLPLTTTAETLLTVPAAELAAEGDYLLTVTARDQSETYRESPAATLIIHVRAPAAEGGQDYANPARYASDYYYNYLSTQENGENLRRYYRLVDTALTSFHTSFAHAESVKVSGGTTHYYAAKLDFAQYGLTLEEAVSVRFMYQYDHPLYYWISNVYVYTSSTLYFCVFPEYVTGGERARYNQMIYEGVAAMDEGLTAETSAYNLALAYYERLLARADYAYEADGETPQDDQWAHNVVGVFDPTLRQVVCEGFAETYSLLLNYHGVENISVPGESRGVGHLWNLLRLDDGGWYWCDITWDDRTYSPLGTDYKYFCVTDTQDVLYYYVRDGIEAGLDYTFSGSATFMDDHTVRWDAGIKLDMSAAIPARAETPYDGEELTLRETFTVDGMTYALTGYGKIQLVEVGSRRSLTVSETVTYDGVTYTVTSIGLINSEGVFMKGRLLPLFTTSVYIPKTVSYIWDGALSGLLVNVTVDPENPWFVSQNGSIKPRN